MKIFIFLFNFKLFYFDFLCFFIFFVIFHMNPFFIFTNHFNKKLNPYIIPSRPNIFLNNLNNHVINHLNSKNDDPENKITKQPSTKTNIDKKRKKKCLNRWQSFVKENYNEVASFLKTRLLIPIIKFLSIEYRKIYVLNKEKKNVAILHQKEDIDMFKDDMEIDDNIDDDENNLIQAFEKIKIQE